MAETKGGRFPGLFFWPLREKLRRIRVPRGIRIVLGPLAGGLLGLVGGVAGVIIGVALGSLIQELFGQFGSDRDIRRYFEHPGPVVFFEDKPGLAAFCGLGVLIAAKSGLEDGEVAVRETSLAAQGAFVFLGPAASSGLADPSAAEQFCRIAWSIRKSLNGDLLLESLVARRKTVGDTVEGPARLGEALYSLAASPNAQTFAEELRSALDPRYKPPVKTDPWKILGISPETPMPEIKAHYRRLAAQFHPDTLQGLDDEHQKAAAHAFIAIQAAYREVTGKPNR